MAKLLGMGGNVEAGTTSVAVSEWSCAASNDVQDVTDTGSGGWVARLAGVSSADISFTAFWGGAAAVLTTTFAIGTRISFTLNVGAGGDTITGNAFITGFTVSNGAKSPVTFQCTAQSDGTVTFPAS